MKSKSSTHSLFLLTVYSIWPHSLCMVPTAGMWVCVLGSRPETQLYLYQTVLNYLLLSTPHLLSVNVTVHSFKQLYGKLFKLESSAMWLTHSESSHCACLGSVMVCNMLESTHNVGAPSVPYSIGTTGSSHRQPIIDFHISLVLTLRPTNMKVILSFLEVGPGALEHLGQSLYHRTTSSTQHRG